MKFRERIRDAFGTDAEGRILRFLTEEELPLCGDDTARWRKLFEACGRWRDGFLLWEERTFVNGIHGWNLSMGAYQLRLPECGDCTAYLYRMTLLAVVSGMSAGERNCLSESGREYHNFSAVATDYYVSGGYESLTREQWLEELEGLLERSWEGYQKFPGTNPAYHREMERNYPKFRSILDRLARETDSCKCEIARMNRYGGDDTVWYFVKTRACLFLLCLSDSM